MYEGLKDYLEKRGFTQPRMAEMLGVTVPYVNAVLLGRKSLGKKNAKKWANLFGLSENYLLTGIGDPGAASEVPDIKQKAVSNLPDSRNESNKDLVNALLAAKDETIASLRQQIEEQKEMIAFLKHRVSDLSAASYPLSDHKESHISIPKP